MDPSVSGLRAASTMMDVAAGNVANVNTPGYKPQRVDLSTAPGGGVLADTRRSDAPVPPDFSGTDLATEVTNQALAGAMYTANLQMVRSRDEATGSLIDVLG